MPDTANLTPWTPSQSFFSRAVTALAAVSLFMNVVSSWHNYRARPLRESASRSLMAERSSFFYASGLEEPVPVAALKAATALGADPDAAVRAEGLAVFVLLVAATYFALRRRYGWACAPMAAMFLSCNLYFGYYAMDGSSHLYALLFLVLFWHFIRGTGPRSAALAGLCAALACLSRADSVFPVLLIAALPPALRTDAAGLKRAGLALGLALALAAPYACWQRSAYGGFFYAQELGLRRFANAELLRADPQAVPVPGPMGAGAFLTRGGLSGALSGAFSGLGGSLAYGLPRAVHYGFLFVLASLGLYAAFALNRMELASFAAASLLPVLPLAAAAPPGGLEARYYLASAWAVCALAAFGGSEAVTWVERKAAERAGKKDDKK